MRRIGIDPGIKGAVVMLEDDTPVEWALMPTMKIGSQNRVNAVALAALLRVYGHSYRQVHAYVELVGARPGQGVTSMYSFGHSCGVIAGVLGAFEIPVTYVTPQMWKMRSHLTNKDKDASRSLAIQMWPHWRELDKKGQGQALADAALIARYGI